MSKGKMNLNQFIRTIIVVVFFACLSYFLDSTNFGIENAINESINSENVISGSIAKENSVNENIVNEISANENNNKKSKTIGELPEYSGQISIQINNNIPYFTENDYTTEAFEKYSELDKNGRCGVAFANVCKKIMPPDGDERGDISSVKPTGWVQKKYDGKYLYNRCHLIGYQLSDEDANELNLITGTRYFNVEGMLPFENEIANYIKKNKNNHVLYRVTPIYQGDNLVANGVEMEAYSVEDNGKGVCFNVFVYNVQPGIKIDYKTGDSFKIQ